MKKNQGNRPNRGGLTSPRRAKLKFCTIHQILYMKKYPHVCEGESVEIRKTLTGRKKGR